MADQGQPIDIDESQDIVEERLVDLFPASGEAVDLDVNQLLSSTENIGLRVLTSLKAQPKSWMLIAGEYARAGRIDTADELLAFAINENFADRVSNPSGIIDALAMQGYLALVRARDAPKTVLGEAKYDRLDFHIKAAASYYQVAADCFRRADVALEQLPRIQPSESGKARLGLWMGKALLALARRDFAQADHLVSLCLKSQPNNLLVLMLSGRLYLQTRRAEQALKAYQQVLQLSPKFGVPSRSGSQGGLHGAMKMALDEGVGMDPRVGLGLSFWLLGDTKKGTLAWKRAIALNPKNRGARFLLGLIDHNEAKNPASPAEERRNKQITATKVFGQLFSESKGKVVPAALGIVRNAEIQGQISKAIKLTERAIQYADTAAHTRRALSERCRLALVEGEDGDVETYSGKLRADPIPDAVAEIVRAQVFIKSGTAFYREALNVVDIAVSKLDKNAPHELRVLHALLLAFPHPGMSAAELMANSKRARDILSRIHDTYKLAKGRLAKGETRVHALRDLIDDPLIFVQLAKMWQHENVEKAIEAYQTAIEIHGRVKGNKGESVIDLEAHTRDLSGLQMSNNLGALYLGQKNVDEAMQMFEQMLEDLGEVTNEEEKTLQTVLLYNLGRAYEEAKENVKADEVFTGLLARHPEHLPAKLRKATLTHIAGNYKEQENLLKEANASYNKDPLLRAQITHHLISQEKWKDASDFASQTRRANQDDVHALCALGAYHYHCARESKATETERARDFVRSAEAYNRALEVDPKCAVAAQGLAIAIAEEHLPSRRGAANGSTDSQGSIMKTKSLDMALGIFNRIRDCLPDRSVLINIGHCQFFKGEEEQAIEAYSAASDLVKGQDTSVLLFLARAYYQLGSRESSFPAMSKALSHCMKAAHLKPHDMAILHNIAMIQQKTAEVILALDPSKRSLQEVEQVIEQAKSSTIIFRNLSETRERPLPYDVDLVDQRSKYGEGLLRRADDQRQKQMTWENEQTERHLEAVRRRQEERRKLEQIEQSRRAEEQARRDEEARIREQQRQEAQAWREQMRAAQEDEDRVRAERAEQKEGRKSKKSKKDKTEDGFISEGLGEEAESKPKKRGRKKAADPDEEPDAAGSGAESRSQSRSRSRSKQPPKPKKKRPAAVDPDGDDPMVPDKPAKRGKFKSKEFIESDSE
ncbi:Pol II transcription elongation factor [Filobasidium floriforme]|uniref:Pol II transcription elongation factor n=1 Tax=Filobasidium floriforme TaxID=5210 RepID=UPI001E8DD3E9|nr:Pol II transcription elongation factor [Filobasidium floriforme]KAH8080146.1 Pol II transcription elongation factor [Filobasidium floriforme]